MTRSLLHALGLLLAVLAGCGGGSSDAAPAKAAPSPAVVTSSFGLMSDADTYTVDTGAGLVFTVRRHNRDGSSKRLGDISSLVYHGVEYQDGLKGSQVNSGFDYLYTGVTAVSVDAAMPA